MMGGITTANMSINRRAIGSTSLEFTQPPERCTDVKTKPHWLGRLDAVLAPYFLILFSACTITIKNKDSVIWTWTSETNPLVIIFVLVILNVYFIVKLLPPLEGFHLIWATKSATKKLLFFICWDIKHHNYNRAVWRYTFKSAWSSFKFILLHKEKD